MNSTENDVLVFFEKHQKKFLPFLIVLIALFGSISIGDDSMIGDIWGIVLWLLAILLSFHVMVGFPALRTLNVSWRTVTIFLVLFMIAFVMRASNVARIPALLNGDESGSAQDAVNFIQGEWNNIFTSGWFSFPAMHPFIQSIFIRFLGENAVGVRMSSVLAGALTIPFLYLLTRRMFNDTVAITAALLLSVLPIHNHMSRIGLNNIWDPFMFLLTLGFLWDGWKHERRISYFLAGLALGFSQYFYATSRVLPPLTIVVVVVFYLIDRQRTKSQFYWILLMFITGIVVMLPLYFFYFGHPMDFQAPFVRVSVFERDWITSQQQNGRTIFGVFWNQILTAIQGVVSMPVHGYYEAGTPILLMPTAFLFELGFLLMLVQLVIKKFRDEKIVLILGWMGTILLGVIFSVDTPASHRYTAALPAFSLIAAYGLVEGINLVKMIFNQKNLKTGWLVYLLVLVIMAKETWFYQRTFPQRDTLGGVNTLITNDFAHYLNATWEPDRQVVFFGYPYMGYDSIAALPFLAPDIINYTSMSGHWGEAPETPSAMGDRVTFFFLDVNTQDIQQIQTLFEGGFLFTRCFDDTPVWNGCYYIYEYDRSPEILPEQ